VTCNELFYFRKLLHSLDSSLTEQGRSYSKMEVDYLNKLIGMMIGDSHRIFSWSGNTNVHVCVPTNLYYEIKLSQNSSNK